MLLRFSRWHTYTAHKIFPWVWNRLIYGQEETLSNNRLAASVTILYQTGLKSQSPIGTEDTERIRCVPPRLLSFVLVHSFECKVRKMYVNKATF